MANNTVDAYAKQALLDWNPTFAKASSHYAISAEKQEFLIEYCNFVKHMASKVTDSPIKIQPDAIIDFTTRIPVGPFFVHNVPQACPENWPFGEFFWNRLSSWAQLLQWSNVESRPTAMLELYIDFALYTKTIVPLPVKPKGKKSAKCQYYLVDQNLEYAETEFKLSQQSFTWNRIVNWTRHHQCPIFPGEWVSQSGALKDLGNSFWVPAVKLTASLTTGALPYQKLHSIFVTPMGKKRKMCMPFRP